jgi:PAS domain S-box-containing protein
MIQAIGRYLRSGENGGRRNVVLAIAVYAVLALTAVVLLARLQQTQNRMHELLVSDDRAIFNRATVEYSRAVEAVLRAQAAPKPGNTDLVRRRFDILHNRLTIFQAGSEATLLLEDLPSFRVLVAKLGDTLRISDAVLDVEHGPTLSPESTAHLMAALDALRPPLEATLAGVIASSGQHRDALQSELDQLYVLLDTSVVAFAVASLAFIAILGRSNRQTAAANRRLRSTAALLTRSEARLNAFLRNAPAVMVITDRARRFEMVNAGAERFYRRDVAALVGRRGDELQATAGQSALAELHQSVLDSGRPQSRQIRHETPAGEVWELTVAFPIHDEIGEIDAIGGIGLDISGLKKFEAEVIRQRERAEEASKTKSRMLANASHELRTPLNAILGFGQVIEGEMLGPVGTDQYRGYATDIVRSGRHLIGVIDTMLSLSRLESGQLELQKERCAPAEVLAAAATLVEGAAAQRGLAFVIEPAPTPDFVVDRGKLTQAVVNLLSNAVKFTQPGGRVSATCRMAQGGEAGGGGIEIVVTDTGIGINQEELERVVLPFTRGGSALVRQQEGTGLGLAITKALVDQHGGELALESRLGTGTTAIIRLPADRIAEDEAQTRIA